MKILYSGGVKSGKSTNAEKRCFEFETQNKPIYLATTELYDSEMKQRITVHQARRKNHFITVEEPLDLYQAIVSQSSVILVECLTMWINNMLYHDKGEQDILDEITKVLKLPQDIVFVINEVGMGIIPDNPIARKFVDISGKVAQLVGSYAEEVYFCVAGQTIRMK